MTWYEHLFGVLAILTCLGEVVTWGLLAIICCGSARLNGVDLEVENERHNH